MMRTGVHAVEYLVLPAYVHLTVGISWGYVKDTLIM